MQALLVISAMIIASPFLINPPDWRPAEASPDQVPARARLGVPFEISANETVSVAGSGVSVKFYNVTEDSRCPADVVCIWAGQVTVMVGLSENSTDLGRFNLTLGAGSNSSVAEQKVGPYAVKLIDVQPYPISSQPASPSDYVATLVVSDTSSLMFRSVLVKALNGAIQHPHMPKLISGWSIEREIGIAIIVLNDDEMSDGRPVRSVIRFVPFSAECTLANMAECIDGQITSISSDIGLREGDYIHYEIGSDRKRMHVSFESGETGNATLEYSSAGNGFTMDIRTFKEVSKPYVPAGNSTMVTLGEGQRDGPLLVQKIFPDRIEGLNYPEYPVAMDRGIPVTLRLGEKASNGCTVFLTLVRIGDESATFVKKVDENRSCPICWAQLDRMSGWP